MSGSSRTSDRADRTERQRTPVAVRDQLRGLVLAAMAADNKLTRRRDIVKKVEDRAETRVAAELRLVPSWSKRSRLYETIDDLIPGMAGGNDPTLKALGAGQYKLTSRGRREAKKVRPRRVALGTRLSDRPGSPIPTSAIRTPIGREFKAAAPAAGSGGTMIAVWDLDEQDAATRAHINLVNQLAEIIARQGAEPRLPTPHEPQFDLAYLRRDGALVVIEVKSIPADAGGQVQQLRLGLGQLLEYRARLNRDSLGVLALTAPPATDVRRRWARVAAANAVQLLITPTSLPR